MIRSAVINPGAAKEQGSTPIRKRCGVLARYVPVPRTCSARRRVAALDHGELVRGREARGAYLGSIYVFDIIWTTCHITRGSWVVEIGDEFEPEFDELHKDVRTEILALTRLLQQFGPQLGRPRVDTLNNSRHANMKELRFSAADGEWRVAFAFDTKRKAILLVAGDKSGVSEKRFYRELIRKADDRFDAHLARLKKERK
jgi:hypothetical protein